MKRAIPEVVYCAECDFVRGNDMRCMCPDSQWAGARVQPDNWCSRGIPRKYWESKEIGKRAAQEILTIWGTHAEATRELGCSTNTIYEWSHGRAAPGAVFLARLHHHGADVIYILTGRRDNHDG